MRLSVLSLVVLALLVMASCEKSEEMTEAQLIEAIQKSSDKTDINPADLPLPSQNTLETDYSESYTEKASYASGLGYEVTVRRGQGSLIGEQNKAYFNNNGKELLGEEKGHLHRHKKGHDRKECFDFVLPVSFTMPDESTITIEEKEDWLLIKEWYQANPGTHVRPQIQFPVDIEFKDGVVLTVNNEEEMQAVFEECKGNQYHEPCFDLVYPISFLMPDGTLISGESKEEIHEAMKAWHQENPGAGGKPELQFPVDIVFEDGSTMTINSKEEMHAALDECD